MTLDRVFREQWGYVLAALIGFLGDFDLAEEATQEAFAIAAERWPREGVPSSPGVWLITTARRRAIDRIRRERVLAAKTRLLEPPERNFDLSAAPDGGASPEDTVDETTVFPDERLELVFTCCHPALATDAQVALTLRTLGGLTTEEIARAFLVGERRWPNAWCGPSARSRQPGFRSGCRPPTCCPTGSPPCSRSST